MVGNYFGLKPVTEGKYIW